MVQKTILTVKGNKNYFLFHSSGLQSDPQSADLMA